MTRFQMRLPLSYLAAALVLASGMLLAYGGSLSAEGTGDRAAAGTTLDTLLESYEIVRLALLDDHLDGVPEAGAKIRDTAQALAKSYDGTAAGVAEDKAGELQALLPDLVKAADELAQAADIDATRASFWTLTEGLIKYRQLAGNESFRVAYCPMAEKSWLQPDGDIGNPYYGQFMAKCGGFVESSERDGE